MVDKDFRVIEWLSPPYQGQRNQVEKRYIDTAEPLDVGGTVTIKYSKKGKVYEGIYLGTTHEAVKKYEDNENTDNHATHLSTPSARLEAQEEHNKPSTSFSSTRKSTKSQRSSASQENKLEKQSKGKKSSKGKSKKEVSNIYMFKQYSSIYKNSDIRTIILCLVFTDRPCH